MSEARQILLLPLAKQGKRKHPDRGYKYERVFQSNGDLEKAFADLWEEANGSNRGAVNFGQGLLQDLFMERDTFNWASCVHQITDNERYVAATVVQWLGTNCGFAFLMEALRKAGYRIVDEREPNTTTYKVPKCTDDTFVLRRPKP